MAQVVHIVIAWHKDQRRAEAERYTFTTRNEAERYLAAWRADGGKGSIHRGIAS